MMKRSRVKSIEKIIEFEMPLKDKEGNRFIPYCKLGWHMGVISPEHYSLCEARVCKHYQRLYLK